MPMVASITKVKNGTEWEIHGSGIMEVHWILYRILCRELMKRNVMKDTLQREIPQKGVETHFFTADLKACIHR